jgi:hypothetical protein
MHFAGTLTVGKVGRFHAIGLGVHKSRLRVPPFVPSRFVRQRVIVGPDYEETAPAEPLHIECPSKQALSRRIAEIDKDAGFVWFSGESEAHRRGSVMVYLPAASDLAANRREDRYGGAFYVGFSQRELGWEPAMLRGVSRGEVALLEQSGKALIHDVLSTVKQ